MIVVKVRYTVDPDFEDYNLRNIQAFLKDFESLDASAFLYQVLRGKDRSFVHLSQYRDKSIQDQVLNMPSFIAFQAEREENLLGEPEIEWLDFTASSKPLF